MKLALHGCCFRIEVELFLPFKSFQKYEVVPRNEVFEIQRNLGRRLRQELRTTEATGPQPDAGS